jgi:hypothetical protein
LVVGTGGVKLAREPQTPDRFFDRQAAHALILRSFAYVILDRDRVNWKGTLFEEDGVPLANCEFANPETALSAS